MFQRIGRVLALTILIGGLCACAGAPTAPAVTPATVSDASTPRRVNDASELPKGRASHIDVVYFHRTERCEACLNAESYTRETLDRYFAGEMQSGLIALQVLDMERPENAALVEKFDPTGSSLYFSVRMQGTEYVCPNPDIWFFTGNKYLFVDTLRKKLASLVGGS